MDKHWCKCVRCSFRWKQEESKLGFKLLSGFECASCFILKAPLRFPPCPVNFPAVLWLFAPPWCVSPVSSHRLPRLSVCVCVYVRLYKSSLCAVADCLFLRVRFPALFLACDPRRSDESLWLFLWVFFLLLLWLPCLLILLVLPVLPVLPFVYRAFCCLKDLQLWI